MDNNNEYTSPDLSLEDLNIIDLADEKGSFCTKLFADLGANVIKIEKPGGDPTRNIGPFMNDDPHPEKSLFFASNNTNKRSITLNLESTTGLDIFKKLIKQTDIVVETYLPGETSRLGIDYPSLSKVNPKLIMASITSFGQTGPHRLFKSSDITCYAMGGLMYQTGDPDMSPLTVGGMQTYYLASLFAVDATLIALYARDHIGQGQHVDVSIQECIASCLEWMCYYTYEGQIVSRNGARHFEACPSDNYPCKDGFWAICVGPYSQMWSKLISWIIRDGFDVGDLAGQEYEIGANRRTVIDSEINPIINKWAATYTKEEIFKIGQENDIAIAPISYISDLIGDEQLNDRNFFKQVEHPVIGSAIYPGNPLTIFQNSSEIKGAPLVGEHNEIVYKELGLTKKDIDSLKKSGII